MYVSSFTFNILKAYCVAICYFRPVTDHNEIAYHFADCIYVHCYNTKLRVLIHAWIMTMEPFFKNCSFIYLFIPFVLQKQQDNPTSVHTSNSVFNTPSKGYQASSTNHVSYLVVELYNYFFSNTWNMITTCSTSYLAVFWAIKHGWT